jgi:DNA helicase-2/ATP-dependent DNA helicase PcrA
MQLARAQAKWMPAGGIHLEPLADGVARGNANTLVVAGPGAGKTELLAQRACFLLETGTCPAPYRILAISFKRDAARNLRDRVIQRCGRELGGRFDSYTFDSFCKGLVDRFRAALPEVFRPSGDYRVLDSRVFNERKVLDFVRSIPSATLPLSTAAREGLNTTTLWWNGFLGRRLSAGGWPAARHNEDIAGSSLWSYLLEGEGGSAVTFPMLGLMTDLLFRTNPLLLSSLRHSYRFVFLDEFQDTSAIHYLVTQTAFKGSNAVVTAVGDNKQRIMVWAGALKKVFDVYEKDFSAGTIRLRQNHRSGRRLVAVQSVIAHALDPSSAIAEYAGPADDDDGECRALSFQDDQAEAEHVASLIAQWIRVDGLRPRDICVLTRMRPADYTARLKSALARQGVLSRVENELQDLLAEPLSEAVLDVLKLASRPSAPESWRRTVDLLRTLRKEEEESAIRRMIDELMEQIRRVKASLAGASSSAADVETLLKNIMRFLGIAEFQDLHPQYLQGTWYDSRMADLVKVLSEARQDRDWAGTLDEIEGVASIPIMTTHKSKGLEYHTVVFVGLEDGAHFNFARNPDEETCGFFVALSRAKKRVVFTFSRVRPVGRSSSQSRAEIDAMYKLLAAAGVHVEQVVLSD